MSLHPHLSPIIGAWSDQPIDERQLKLMQQHELAAQARQQAYQRQLQQQQQQQQYSPSAPQHHQQQQQHSQYNPSSQHQSQSQPQYNTNIQYQASSPTNAYSQQSSSSSSSNNLSTVDHHGEAYHEYYIDPNKPMSSSFVNSYAASTSSSSSGSSSSNGGNGGSGGPLGGWQESGKLKSMARHVFERAYGLNGQTREDHESLCEEVMRATACSRKSFCELVYGHSYAAELTDLRAMVPGYRPKERRRRDASERGRGGRKKQEDGVGGDDDFGMRSNNNGGYGQRSSNGGSRNSGSNLGSMQPLSPRNNEYYNNQQQQQPVTQNPMIHLTHRLIPSPLHQSQPQPQYQDQTISQHTQRYSPMHQGASGMDRFAPPASSSTSSSLRASPHHSPLLKPIQVEPNYSPSQGPQRRVDVSAVQAAAIAAAQSVSPHLGPFVDQTNNPIIVPQSPHLAPVTGATLKSSSSAATVPSSRVVGSPLRQSYGTTALASGPNLPPRGPSPSMNPYRTAQTPTLTGAAPPGFSPAQSPRHASSSLQGTPIQSALPTPAFMTMPAPALVMTNAGQITGPPLIPSPVTPVSVEPVTPITPAPGAESPIISPEPSKSEPLKQSELSKPEIVGQPKKEESRNVPTSESIIPLTPPSSSIATIDEEDGTEGADASAADTETESSHATASSNTANSSASAISKKALKKARAKAMKQKQEEEQKLAAAAAAAEAAAMSNAKKSSSNKKSSNKANRKLSGVVPTSPPHYATTNNTAASPLPAATATDSVKSETPSAPAVTSSPRVFLVLGVSFAGFFLLRMILPSLLYDAAVPSTSVWSLISALYLGSLFFYMWQFRSTHDANQVWSGVVLELSNQLDKYVTSWELLAVDDPNQLLAAIQQIQTLLDAALASFTGLSSAPDATHAVAALEHAVQTMDFLHLAHRNLISELGSTQPIMRLVASLGVVRNKLMEVRSKVTHGTTVDQQQRTIHTSMTPSSMMLISIAAITTLMLVCAPPLSSTLLTLLLPLGLLVILLLLTLFVWSSQYPFKSSQPDHRTLSGEMMSLLAINLFVSLEPLNYLRERLHEKENETKERIEHHEEHEPHEHDEGMQLDDHDETFDANE